MLAAVALPSVSYAPAFSPAAVHGRATVPRMETVQDLEELAVALNPSIGYWDPLGMVDTNVWNKGQEATIGWLRHAEIKHGRVAMAAFVGYCVQANGLYFPWALQGGPLSPDTTVMFADIAAAGGPSDQWDALPSAAKLQILGFVLLLESLGEKMKPHYTKGGQPGFYPSLKEATDIPHPVPFDLYDPFGLFGGMDEETKQRRLLMEINNGRLAMLGIFSLISASKGLIVPGLEGKIPPYTGQPMGAFSETDIGLPFVSNMLEGVAKTGFLQNL